MKHLLNILLFIFCGSISAQNYIDYFHICNDADKAVFDKDYPVAMNLYEEAFNLVPYVHDDYLIKAINCASKVKRSDLTVRYLTQYYLQCGDSSVFEMRAVRKQRKTVSFQRLKDSLMALKIHPYNLLYQKALDSIIFIDQKVLRNNFKDTAGYNLKTDEDWENLESQNFQKLLRYIEQYGYPSERLIGKEHYDYAYVVLLHNIRLDKNRSNISIVEKALMEGDCLPEDYGWLVDQACSNDSTPFKFYLFESSPKKLNTARKAEINKERFNYGIKPIEAFGAIKLFNMLITYKKW